MEFIDTHAHIYQPDYAEDLAEIVQNSLENGISRIYMPNVDVDSIAEMNRLTELYPERCFAMMGLHPTSVDAGYKQKLARVEEALNSGNYCAVGEIGIDLYWDKTYQAEQTEVFLQQVQWARQKGLPAVIHTRNSTNETLEALEKCGTDGLTAIFHSFCEDEIQARRILAHENFYLGINGIVTFKNSGLAETLRNLPIERLVLETDSPYLTPTPFRGKRNSPAHIRLIAQKLAEVYGIPLSEVAEITTKNANRIFGQNKRAEH